MKTKKHLFLILLLAVSTLASAQIKVPNTRVSFSFPNTGWKYLQTTTVDKNTTVYLYSFNGHIVIDNAGDTILPFMRIYVRKNFDGSVYDLAFSRFMTQPFQSLDEKVHDDGILEYLGAYTNEEDNKDYEFRMLYLKDKSTMLEIRVETSTDNYDEFEKDFQAILASIKINK